MLDSLRFHYADDDIYYYCSFELECTIHISSMSKLDYQDNQLGISYLIDDSVLALSHAIPVAAARQLLAPRRPGLFPKQLNPANQSLAVSLRGNGQKLLSGRGLYQHPIFSHYASVP